MKRQFILDGRSVLCDTNRSKKLAVYDNGLGGENHMIETLYRTRSGRYFLHGVGGFLTKWNGEKLALLARDEAEMWVRGYQGEQMFNIIFGATSKQLTVNGFDGGLRAMLEKDVELENITLKEVLERAVKYYYNERR